MASLNPAVEMLFKCLPSSLLLFCLLFFVFLFSGLLSSLLTQRQISCTPGVPKIFLQHKDKNWMMREINTQLWPGYLTFPATKTQEIWSKETTPWGALSPFQSYSVFPPFPFSILLDILPFPFFQSYSIFSMSLTSLTFRSWTPNDLIIWLFALDENCWCLISRYVDKSWTLF